MNIITIIKDWYTGKREVTKKLGVFANTYMVKKVVFADGKKRYYPMKKIGNVWVNLLIDYNEGKYKCGFDLSKANGVLYNHYYYMKIKHAYKAIINSYMHYYNVEQIHKNYKVIETEEITFM